MKTVTRQIFLTGLAFLVMAPVGYAADVAAIDAIRFPEENWSHALLESIEDGPDILGDALMAVPVDPPPANSSVRTQYELETLRAYKNERSEDVIAQIKKENAVYSQTRDYFASVITLDDVQHANTLRLIEAVVLDVSYFVMREKQRFQRPRPSQLADDLDPVIDNPGHAAYPSGHAAQMYAAALVLSILDPARQDMYIKAAFDIARRREIAGVHYPSDSMAGFKLAEFVVDELMKTPEIQALLPQAKAEFISH